MKVLITTIYEYPHEGGLSTHISTLKKGLEELGHTVDVTSGTDCPKGTKLYIRGISYLIRRFNKGKGQLYGDRLRMQWLKDHLGKLYTNYDVINTQDIFATLAVRDFNIHTVETVHGYYTYEAISRGAIEANTNEANKAKRFERYAYKSADKLVTVDYRLKDYINTETNRIAQRIHNFIDIDTFNQSNSQTEEISRKYNIPKNSIILLVPRRLTEKNGVLYPILALRDVLIQFPEVKLVYAGSGELMEELKEKVRNLYLQNHVYFLGSVPHHEMIHLYNISDAVIVPSIHAKGVEEATSIAALEGMAAGKPVIAGAVGGLKEIINHEENGLLFENQNANDLSTNIKRVLHDKELYRSITVHAQEYIKGYHSHISAAKQFLSVYEKQGQY